MTWRTERIVIEWETMSEPVDRTKAKEKLWAFISKLIAKPESAIKLYWE